MTEQLLTLQIDDSARIAYASLGADERRLVDAWFDHLRNWHHDEFVRSRSRRLKPDDDLYAFQTNSDDLVIAFRIAGGAIHVLSIFRREWLRAFEAQAAQGTA